MAAVSTRYSGPSEIDTNYLDNKILQVHVLKSQYPRDSRHEDTEYINTVNSA